jgi:hypothetical protein
LAKGKATSRNTTRTKDTAVCSLWITGIQSKVMTNTVTAVEGRMVEGTAHHAVVIVITMMIIHQEISIGLRMVVHNQDRTITIVIGEMIVGIHQLMESNHALMEGAITMSAQTADIPQVTQMHLQGTQSLITGVINTHQTDIMTQEMIRTIGTQTRDTLQRVVGMWVQGIIMGGTNMLQIQNKQTMGTIMALPNQDTQKGMCAEMIDLVQVHNNTKMEVGVIMDEIRTIDMTTALALTMDMIDGMTTGPKMGPVMIEPKAQDRVMSVSEANGVREMTELIRQMRDLGETRPKTTT